MAQGKFKAHQPVPGKGKKSKHHKKAITKKGGIIYCVYHIFVATNI